MRKNIILLAISLFSIVMCTSTKEEVDDSLYRILVENKAGFINSQGKIIIEPQYDYANRRFSEGLCYVQIGKRHGIVDRTGNFLFDVADSVWVIREFDSGLATYSTSQGEHEGIIDNTGHVIVPAKYLSASVNVDGEKTFIILNEATVKHPSDNLTIISNSKWHIKDKNGRFLVKDCDSILVGFCNGLCAIKKQGKWGYIDASGEFVIKPDYDIVNKFTKEGIARVKSGEKWSYIDKNGSCLFFVDQALTDFYCNRTAAIIDGKKYLFDKNGNKVCLLDADDVSRFSYHDQKATIIKNGQSFKIDSLGNVVLSTKYELLGAFEKGLAIVYNENKYGFIDQEGKEVIPVIFDDYEIYIEESNLIAVSSDDTPGQIYYDLHGNVIWRDSINDKATVYFPHSSNNKKDYIEYYDAHLSELDPIEGIYYVTSTDYYQDRSNPSEIGTNGSNSEFYSIVHLQADNEFEADCMDESNDRWVNKFVRIGNSNNYAIQKINKDSKYSSDGQLTLEDPCHFQFKLDRGHNNYYNFFVIYEFIKDYPPASEIEKVQKAEWTGSGFAIADGLIATNYHVTSGAKSIRVRGVNGKLDESYECFVVVSDKEHDLSIIRVVDKDFDSFGTIPYCIGKVSVDVGDDVFVLGYPLITTMGEEVKLTSGVISSSTGYKGDESMYQISAAVQPGNSGGPLFNSKGDVIGVVCGKHSDAEDVNYAVKATYLYRLVSSSDTGIKMSDTSKLKIKKRSSIVKKVKDYVFLIECSSK